MLYKEPKSIDAVTERAITQVHFELLRFSFRRQVADRIFLEITHHYDKRITTSFRRSFSKSI